MARNFADAGYSMENKTIEKQLVKIENMLKAHDDKDYVFVIGHHYISTCPTNDSNHAFNFLNDIFIKHRISAYIFGHHHSLQSVQKDGIIYIQSGSGGQNHGLCKGMDGWGAAEFGFTNLQVTKKNSFFTFISSNGTALHTEVAKPRLKSRLLQMQNDKQVFTEAS
jgi:acid phosphatase